MELFGISYDIVPDGHLPPGVEASCLPELRRIDIAESTYMDICRNDPRARFTLIHELGHLILAHSRSFHRDVGPPTHELYEDSEWQADCFAAEFLMPIEVIKAKAMRTPWDLQIEFNVSYQAASYRLDNLMRRREL
ncbi:ImmA/IrrE family metallo-endopeptidase [Cupriavidus taiwanensis]|uniref:ImmA/IrrE family metallo-endopeptidase n=1 Tax=Cupriavidus taiwanensis TaxID=164546 RepID=UPI0018DB0B07|nr:ImmA/IrrE family metallo-endopeptidase [Cupriavidus taiwanensis]